MTDRLLVYPLLFLTLLQLGALCRQTPRWFSSQIGQRGLILITCGVALVDSRNPVWVGIAWIEFALLVIGPVLAAQRALRWMLAGEFSRAAGAWRAVARFNWSQQGQAYRRLADALQHSDTELVLKELEHSLPSAGRAEVNLWRLWWWTGNRNWQKAIASYEAVEVWGSLPSAMQARLAAARAYAELNLPERATRCLVWVAVSPRTVGRLAAQLWMTRVVVAALAGDAGEMERLLAIKPEGQRGFARFAAVWRGRCAARRGDRPESGRQLSRALALTPAALPKTREVLTGYLEQPESSVPITEQYRVELGRLQQAEVAMGPWRRLVHVGWPPQLTVGLLVMLVGMFAVDRIGFRQSLFVGLGNLPFGDCVGDWWRPVTAMFLHANLLHLVANIAGLWMFGGVIERTWGRWRMLAVFILAGVTANVASAWIGGFDVSVGASGGIFGLVAAFGVAAYRLRAPVPAAVRRRLLWLTVALVAADFVSGAVELQVDGVAHAGGFAVGLVLAWGLGGVREGRLAKDSPPLPQKIQSRKII